MKLANREIDQTEKAHPVFALVARGQSISAHKSRLADRLEPDTLQDILNGIADAARSHGYRWVGDGGSGFVRTGAES